MDEQGEDPHEPAHPPAPAEHQDYEEAARSTADYANYAPPKKPKRKWLRRLTLVLLILVLAGAVAGAGIYWFVLRTEPPAKLKPTKETGQTTPPAPTTKITTATKRHDSPNFYLGFDYPQDWMVTDSGGGVMTVSSTVIDLTNAAGQRVKGQIVLTIKAKDQKLPEFDSGNAFAARASEKISYTKPSPTQRGSTHLSFLRYASSPKAEGDFDGVYITGDTGYQKGQAIPKADFTPVDPLISVTYIKGGKPITVSDNMWDNPDYSKPIKAMLQSLSIT